MVVFAIKTIIFLMSHIYTVRNIDNTGLEALLASTTVGLEDGTAADPSLYFAADEDTGLYRVGANHIGVTCGGVERMALDATEMVVSVPLRPALPVLGQDGTAAAPAYAFASDPDTGIYSVGANQLGFTTAGVVRADLFATRFNFDVPVHLENGTAAGPSCTFQSDTDTGLFRVGANQMGFSTGGVQRADLSTTALTSTLPVLGGDGGVITPTYSFSAEANTGIWRAGAGRLSFSTGGAFSMDLSTTSLDVNAPIYEEDGSALTPSYTFQTDPDTGLFRVAANHMGFTTNGVLRFEVSNGSINSVVPIYASNGSAAFPGYAFQNSPGLGFNRIGTDRMGFSAGGVRRMELQTTDLTMSVPLLATAGSAAAPPIAFAADPNTGIYCVSADRLGLTAGGVVRADMSTTFFNFDVPIYVQDGGQVAPGFAFQSDTNLGLFRAGVDRLGLTAGGVERMEVHTDRIECFVPMELDSQTVAGVPSASPAGMMLYISNETGGAVPAFSDGTNWRRVTDRTIIA